MEKVYRSSRMKTHPEVKIIYYFQDSNYSTKTWHPNKKDVSQRTMELSLQVILLTSKSEDNINSSQTETEEEYAWSMC